MSKGRQNFVPQPDTGVRPNQSGKAAAAALGNNIFQIVTTPAPAAAHDGNVVEPFLFTPKVSGKLLVTADVAGNTNIEMNVTFTINVGGQVFTFNTRAAGTGAITTLNISRTLIASGFPIGTPITIRFDWACIAAPGNTFQPHDGEGGVTVVELLT